MKYGVVWMRVKGLVRWFSQYKGYGFLDVDNLEGDVFIHFSLVDSMGYKELNSRDELDCEIELKGKGYQVTKIYSIKPADISQSDEVFDVECKVKWFNPAKGYGFAADENSEDIFIHGSLLKALNIRNLTSGTRLIAKVCKQHKGYEALSIRLA